MKKWITVLSVMTFVSCGSQPGESPKSTKGMPVPEKPKDTAIAIVTPPVPDSLVALKFLNDYIEYCNKGSKNEKATGTWDWLKQQPVLTDNFKAAYKKLEEKAKKDDPEMGLDFDPIFDAQDYPDKGMEILACEGKTGFVTLRGKAWKDFLITVRLVSVNSKWLVDGAGVINIPEEKRPKR
jgi:hypothetical protein